MSIPAGLILLGASFGRLKMPKKWSDIPVGAIIVGSIIHFFAIHKSTLLTLL